LIESTKSYFDESIRLQLIFRLFYLGEEDDKVEIEEVKEIDFIEIKKRLYNGESVFIAPKLSVQEKEKGVPKYQSKKNCKSHWYFTHV